MPQSRVLYYITDRTAFSTDETTRRKCLLEKIREATRAGVDYIQLREKDLSTSGLESLCREAIGVLRELGAENPKMATKLLINSRADVALAAGADGVHLRSDDISPQQVAAIWRKAHAEAAAPGCPPARSAATARVQIPSRPLIGISCHSPDEVRQAEANGASFAVFAPVFEKKDTPGGQPAGLSQLREACKAKLPVLALGGISLENAPSCLEAGAAGIAAIRLFQENDVAKIVDDVRRWMP